MATTSEDNGEFKKLASELKKYGIQAEANEKLLGIITANKEYPLETVKKNVVNYLANAVEKQLKEVYGEAAESISIEIFLEKRYQCISGNAFKDVQSILEERRGRKERR